MQTLLRSAAAAVAVLLTVGLAWGQPTGERRAWTLMIYGAADNNADGPILEFLDELRVALDDDPGMELVLFLDRSEGFSDDARSLGEDFTGARVYRLGKESAELLDAADHFPGMGAEAEYEVDSADPKTLGRFVAFCKQRFPAERYGLMIYSHANGVTMCPDDESGRSMNIPELTDEVGEEASVDLLALELCNMGGIEIAYQWRPGNGGFSAEFLLAVPNAGQPLDWARAFARIRSEGRATTAEGDVLDPRSMTAADFGRLVIEEGHAGRRAEVERMAATLPPEVVADALEYGHDFLREAAGLYDLRAAARVKRAVDELAVLLSAEEGARAAFEELRGPGDAPEVMHYGKLGRFRERPYVDLYQLMERAAESARLSDPIRDAAAAVCDAVDELVLASFGVEQGFPGFQPGRNGIFIVFPDGDAPLGATRAWKDFAWYTPLDPRDAFDPYGRWEFLAAGATPGNGAVENWFELLDAWYDDTSGGPEGLNRYAW